MSKQLLNEKTFEAPSVSEFTRGAPVTRTMTYAGTALRALFLVVVTIGFAMVGWRPRRTSWRRPGCGSSSAICS